MNDDNKKSVKIVLDIEWTMTDNFDLPENWDWRRIKSSMDIDRVKYLGELDEVIKKIKK